MGETVCRAVEGADDMELVGPRRPRAGRRPRRGARRRRGGGRLLAARHRAGQRARVPRGRRALRDRHHRRRLLRARGRRARPTSSSAPNFAIGAVLMMEAAKLVAAHMPECEIVELHHDGKLDAPSGTAAHTADVLARGRRPTCTSRSTRCACPASWPTRRCSSAALGQTLSIRHDSISRESFMPGRAAGRAAGGLAGALAHGGAREAAVLGRATRRRRRCCCAARAAPRSGCPTARRRSSRSCCRSARRAWRGGRSSSG